MKKSLSVDVKKDLTVKRKTSTKLELKMPAFKVIITLFTLYSVDYHAYTNSWKESNITLTLYERPKYSIPKKSTAPKLKWKTGTWSWNNSLLM